MEQEEIKRLIRELLESIEYDAAWMTANQYIPAAHRHYAAVDIYSPKKDKKKLDPRLG